MLCDQRRNTRPTYHDALQVLLREVASRGFTYHYVLHQRSIPYTRTEGRHVIYTATLKVITALVSPRHRESPEQTHVRPHYYILRSRVCSARSGVPLTGANARCTLLSRPCRLVDTQHLQTTALNAYLTKPVVHPGKPDWWPGGAMGHYIPCL